LSIQLGEDKDLILLDNLTPKDPGAARIPGRLLCFFFAVVNSDKSSNKSSNGSRILNAQVHKLRLLFSYFTQTLPHFFNRCL